MFVSPNKTTFNSPGHQPWAEHVLRSTLVAPGSVDLQRRADFGDRRLDVSRGLVARVNLTERGVEHLGRLVKIRVGLCLGNFGDGLTCLAASLLVVGDLYASLLVIHASLLIFDTSLVLPPVLWGIGRTLGSC